MLNPTSKLSPPGRRKYNIDGDFCSCVSSGQQQEMELAMSSITS